MLRLLRFSKRGSTAQFAPVTQTCIQVRAIVLTVLYIVPLVNSKNLLYIDEGKIKSLSGPLSSGFKTEVWVLTGQLGPFSSKV